LDGETLMDRTPDNWLTRRSLFKGRLFEVAHVVCRPTPDLRHEVTYAGLNVLALPTAGKGACTPHAMWPTIPATMAGKMTA